MAAASSASPVLFQHSWRSTTRSLSVQLLPKSRSRQETLHFLEFSKSPAITLALKLEMLATDLRGHRLAF
uniref:ABC transporter I family member 11ic isoform X2 n=1 Tax=Rhizophora mucronata TaxID=61149 RepID=A0A2P2MUD9_RHIMU